MAKKNEDIDIEEILLRQVAGRYDEGQTPQEVPQPLLSASEEQPLQARPPAPRKASTYEQVFLHENPVQLRSVIYINADTKRKLTQVAHRLGWSKVSVTALADNILSNHLEVFRDEINRLHKVKNTKAIL